MNLLGLRFSTGSHSLRHLCVAYHIHLPNTAKMNDSCLFIMLSPFSHREISEIIYIPMLQLLPLFTAEASRTKSWRERWYKCQSLTFILDILQIMEMVKQAFEGSNICARLIRCY